MIPDRAQHRAFLNRYYGATRRLYDVTRRYYLLGRDRALRELLAEPWTSLVEVGPGTGRNLRLLHAGRPAARFGGIEASDAMLTHARARCPFAALALGFAEDADLAGLLGTRPERVLFSYCLSMVQDPLAAITRAREALAPGGEVVVVDFGDLVGVPGPLRRAFLGFLSRFHTHPLALEQLAGDARCITYGPGRYYFHARFGPP